MATERELKFSTLDEHVPSLPELNLALEGSGLLALPGRVSRHVDVYYDAGGALGAAGVALRRRRRQGPGPGTEGGIAYFPVQVTVKSGSTVTGALHERTERQWQVGPERLWPQEVEDAVAAVPGATVNALQPVAELRIRRVAFLVASATADADDADAEGAAGTEGAAPLAELAFDEVTCSATHDDGLSATFHEVEIEALGEESVEALGGSLADDRDALTKLTTIADAVASMVKLTPSSASKLERARALLDAIVGS